MTIRDQYHNFWPLEQRVFNKLTTSQFQLQFEGYAYVLIEISSDKIVAAGQSEENLWLGVAEQRLDATGFHIKPVPFSVEAHAAT